MKVLAQLLKTIQRVDGRVLLFSESTRTLDLIESFACATGYSFLRMDGSTPQRKRVELAEQFKSNHNFFLFLLSTKAMGLGLNLTRLVVGKLVVPENPSAICALLTLPSSLQRFLGYHL